MKEKIENALQRSAAAQKAWDELYALMANSGLQMERSYPSIQGSTLEELNSRLNATFVLAESLRSIDDNGAVLVSPRLPSITGALTQIEQNANGAIGQLRAYNDATFSDPSGNLTVQISRGGSVVTNLNLANYLDVIAGQQMALLDVLTLALRFGRYKGAGLFQERARELQVMSAELASMLENGRKALADLKETLESADAILVECTSVQENCADHRNQVVAMLPEAQRAANEIEAKLSHIREIAQAANSLSTQVEDYEGSFSAFQESLEGRVAAHEKFASDMKVAMEDNHGREAAIDGLIEKADAMVKGATTAGLSLSLDEAKSAYERRLEKTGWWFLGSVVILLVCLIPIAGQLIPGPWQEWFKGPSGGNSDPWLATLGKFILLLPATWATAFFAGNYAELFHLHREYAHKAAMAKAIDGFKREAPQYREEIVAGVFMEIRESPGSRKAPSPATPENPITRTFLEKVLEQVQLKKSER
jgi:hypothetical protein